MIASRLIPVLAIFVALLTAATVWLALTEVDTQKRLGPVGVVGPCREFGPKDKECRRQSRKIVRSCLIHKDCLALIDRLLRRAERHDTHGISRIGDNEGGGSQQTEPPSQQPPPGHGGNPGNPVGNPPTTPQVQLPDLPEPAQQTVDQVCETAPVQLPIC